MQRKPRGERAQPGVRESLAGEPQPARLSDSQTARRRAHRRARSTPAPAANFLLYGATGSGKTEVYLQACAAALERGLGAIVLVPEIALTPQAVGRFRARFGERVALLHSGLTEAERRDERLRIASGEARIVVGARSAVFAPVRGLGLICVDEEHDPSYKQESDPRYDARTVAAKRASLEGAVAVFGSATPRPESWESARAARARRPHRRAGCRRSASSTCAARPAIRCRRRCSQALEQVVARGEKAILLLNRRGVAPALHCRACGTTIRCENCDVALVLHGDGTLRCHHCGSSEPAPELCPACASAELARIGAGTQRLERELAERDARPALASASTPTPSSSAASPTRCARSPTRRARR